MAPPWLSLSRRRFFKLGLAGSALLVTGSVVAYVRTRGYAIAPGRKWLAFSAWHVIVAEHAARRIAAADVPSDRAIPTADETDVVGFMDGYISRAPPDLRRDFLRFLAYLEHMAPLAERFGARFSRLAPEDQDRVLESLERSGTPLLRAGFEGLKALVFMGYYRDPRTWHILAYAGPKVNRPAGGWW